LRNRREDSGKKRGMKTPLVRWRAGSCCGTRRGGKEERGHEDIRSIKRVGSEKNARPARERTAEAKKVEQQLEGGIRSPRERKTKTDGRGKKKR